MVDDENPAARAVEFRKRATAIRAMVKGFETAEAREGLLRIADDWDRLAEAAEREAKRAPQ